jgi:hypothetical protein
VLPRRVLIKPASATRPSVSVGPACGDLRQIKRNEFTPLPPPAGPLAAGTKSVLEMGTIASNQPGGLSQMAWSSTNADGWIGSRFARHDEARSENCKISSRNEFHQPFSRVGGHFPCVLIRGHALTGGHVQARRRLLTAAGPPRQAAMDSAWVLGVLTQNGLNDEELLVGLNYAAEQDWLEIGSTGLLFTKLGKAAITAGLTVAA